MCCVSGRRHDQSRRVCGRAELQTASVNARQGFRFADNQTANSPGGLPWWKVFNDPILQGLTGVSPFTSNQRQTL
jgi:hypothetical protein